MDYNGKSQSNPSHLLTPGSAMPTDTMNRYRHVLPAPLPPPAPLTPVWSTGRQVNIFQALRRGKWKILAFLIVGILVGVAAVWRQPYIYRAKVLLELEDLNQNVLNSRDVNPAAPMDNSSETYINTEAQILQSGPVFAGVADVLNRPAAGPAATQVSSTVSSSGASTEASPSQSPWDPPITAGEVAHAVRVQTHETDRIVELDVDSPDPKRAAAIANSITTQFVAQDLSSRVQANRQTSAWLNVQLDELGRKLRQSEDDLRAFTVREKMLADEPAGGGVDETGLRQVQAELARAEADRISKQSVMEQLAKSQQTSDSAVEDPTLQQYRVELSGLRKQLADLEETFAPGYYKIPALRAQIASVQQSYDQQRKAVLEQKNNEYTAAKNREDLLKSRYDAQFQAATGQSAKMVEYSSLKNAVELNRNIYAEILQKVKSYSVAAAMQTSNVRVVEPAAIPEVPNRPNKPLYTALSGLGFLFVGIVWVVSRAAGDNRIQEPGETSAFMQSPELGVIPSATARSVYGSAGRLPWQPRAGKALDLAAWNQNLSLIAESFRSTTASLLLPSDPLSVMVITSLNPADGKTTVASNLAIALTGASRRVLLIDADRRRPRLHAIFGRPNHCGLSDLLESESQLDVSRYITDSRVPNLYILPSGKARPATADLLYSDRLASILTHCRRMFDVVVIDTPPVLHLPDARIIGRLCDGLILVLRAGRVRSNAVIATEERLRRDGVPVMGTILNDWNPKSNGYGSYPEKYV